MSSEPIIANSRPAEIDSYIFATITCLIMSIVFFPLWLLERKKLTTDLLKCSSDNSADNENKEFRELDSLLNGYKNHKKLFVYLGINFSVAGVLFFWGYQLAGAINGALAQKMDLVFALLFGFLINKEKISKTQILFSIILFFGLTLAITRGSFNLLEFNLGVIFLLITTVLWMSAHTITKPILKNKEITPIQLMVFRNIIGFIVLIIPYFFIFGIQNVRLFLSPINLFYFAMLGIVYSVDLYFWYLTITYLPISKASIIMAPSSIITAFFATILLQEFFTIFHLIGSVIVILSIIVIVRPDKK